MRLTYRFDWNRHKKVKFPGKKGHSAGSAVALRPWPGFTAFRRTVKIGGACAVLIFLAGCLATGVQPPAKRPNPPPPVHLHAGEVIETATGRAIGMDQLAANLSRVAVVYVGEEHTSVQDHGVQLEILRRLSRSGRCVELAMEMFPANSQPVLDRYIHGQMSERHFLREVKWNEVWGFPYSLYKGLIDWQKQNHMPVIGLNAPYPVVRKIARHGLGSLTPVERSQVARVFHMDNPADRERVKKSFMAHGKYEIKDFESFFEAQLAWEETIAQTLARRLDYARSQEQTNCMIVVVLGKGHINKRYGVPHLTLLRRPDTTFSTVVPVPADYSPSAIDPSLADYVVITSRSKRFERPRLGVMIEPAVPGPGVRIAAVIPDTPAAKAHLNEGDIIVSVNGAPVKTVKEVQRALSQGGPVFKILIERKNVRLTVDVTIPP